MNVQPIYLKDYEVPPYLINTVDLEFDLQEEQTTVKSTLTVCANPASSCSTSELVLVGEALVLVSVELDGKTLSEHEFKIENHSLTVFSVPQAFNLVIVTRIKPQENTALSGLYKSRQNFCTQCEAQGFRRITYFLDRPDVMATYTTLIRADEKRYPVLLSNGNCVASGKLDNGRHWVKWEDPFKKPCYLFALVAGSLEHIEDYFITSSGRRVVLRIYVEKGDIAKCDHAMQAVKKAMRWDEEKYGREYDLDIYMIVAVSDFNMGAMENKGLNIFNTKYILATPDTATDLDYVHVESVIAHEYFHNWTGNRITCRDWFQLSLKEGLTIFRDQNFTADTTLKTVSRIRDVNGLRAVQFVEDAGPLAHPVRPESYIEINNFYTATVYEKGSEVIRMIQTIIGETAFRKGMDVYFARYDGQAVTIEEFVKAHEEASGVDLSQFRRWYSQAGTPELHIESDYDANQKKYSLRIRQTCPATPGQSEKLPLVIPIEIGLMNSSGQEVHHELVVLKESQQDFYFADIQEKPVPSLARQFSAPVKIHYAYSDQELSLLFQHDTDLFNRWEAGQKYAVSTLLRLVENIKQKKPLLVSDKYLTDYLNSFKYVLASSCDDLSFLAELLTLPSEKYLSQQMDIVDVDAIHEAREFLLRSIAQTCQNDFEKIYHAHHDLKQPYEFSMMEMGKRAIKNVCLSYLSELNEYVDLVSRQFSAAVSHNMTDTVNALKCLSDRECAERESALCEFYQKWKQDALVVDKWFLLQASSKMPGTLERVKRLLHHEAFDIKNPNKVYSLIGGFGNNAVQFHAKSGEGYRFLTEIVLQLNALNPQVASRMVKPLTDWKRYDPERQAIMRDQLQLLLADKSLSKDVYELVSKSI